MISHDVNVRVRYAETDKMGYVYYGNYAMYYEIGRVETLRHIGSSYKDLEYSGVMLPVSDYRSKFIRPAKYDDLLTVRTFIRNKPGVRIVFDYEIYNQDNVLLNTAETTLVFVNAETMRPCNPPEHLMELMCTYFSD